MTYPVYWPLEDGETEPVIKSLNTPFNWRPPGDRGIRLNAGCPPPKRGPKVPGGFAKNGGTMTPLTKRQEKFLAPRVLRHAGPIEPFIAGGNDGL